MSKVIVHVPKGPVNRRSLKRVPMYRPTYSFWLPYGMPKQRIKGHRHERKEADRWQVTWGAPRIALKEPMPTGEGVWMPIDEWWQWTDKDTRGIVNCTINKWGEDELIVPPYKPKLSKVQADTRQYGGTDNVHWNFDAACAETIPPSECFASPEGYWQAGIWHTAEPKPVTPKLKQIDPEDAKPKLKGNMPKWDAYRVLRSAFGDKANVAFEVCNSWAFSEDGRKEAVAQAMLWAWEYARKEFASRSKCLHDRILPAHLGAKPPEYIRQCVGNALREASGNDGTAKWERGRKGQECGECFGTGKGEYGEPCETCDATGKLTRRAYHRKMRITAIDPQEGKDFEVGAYGDDGAETSEALTSLNNPKYRPFSQQLWDDYARQIEHWAISTSPNGTLADTKFGDGFTLDIAAEKIDPKALEWLKLHELDGYSYQEISKMTGIATSTINDRVKRLTVNLAKDDRFQKFTASAVTKRRYGK